MAPRGAIFRFNAQNSVAMLLDDHDLVAMTMMPSAMVAAVAVTSVFGTRAIAVVMMTMVTATLDHDGLGACNRRRRDDERTKCGDNKSQLLHSSPPQLIEDRTSHRGERSNGTRRDF